MRHTTYRKHHHLERKAASTPTVPDVSPELSRRAGRAMSTWTFIDKGQDIRQPFIDAIVEAGTFDKLPDKWQKLILACEKDDGTVPEP